MMVIFGMVIPATVFAIGTVPSFYSLWTQFPDSKNKVTGIAVMFFSLAGILWNYLFMMIVNPHNEKATINDEENGLRFFDEKVTKNV